METARKRVPHRDERKTKVRKNWAEIKNGATSRAEGPVRQTDDWFLDRRFGVSPPSPNAIPTLCFWVQPTLQEGGRRFQSGGQPCECSPRHLPSPPSSSSSLLFDSLSAVTLHSPIAFCVRSPIQLFFFLFFFYSRHLFFVQTRLDTELFSCLFASCLRYSVRISFL